MNDGIRLFKNRHSRAEHDIKEENLNEIKTIIDSAISPINSNVQQIQNRLNEEKQTEILNLRCEMLDIYHRCKSQGYAEEADRVTFDELHDRYKRLGGNHYSDFLNNVRHEILKLPRVVQNEKEN